MDLHGGPARQLENTGVPPSEETAPPLGPYSRTMPKTLWSYGEGCFLYEYVYTYEYMYTGITTNSSH